MNLKTIRRSISELRRDEAIQLILDIRRSRRTRKIREPSKPVTRASSTAPVGVDKLDTRQLDSLLEALMKISDERSNQ